MTGGGSATGGGASGTGLSARYPGDVGIGAASTVVWHETFEQATVTALVARYDSVRTNGLTLVNDPPAGSPGTRAGRFAAAPGADTTDLFKRLPGDHDELFVRYYVKYEAAPYHHAGLWVGGYNPATLWPNPMAGVQPNGSDRISVGLEPASTAPAGRRLDFYNVWYSMRSWQGFSYGNHLINRADLQMRPGQWQCIEYQVKLNTNVATAQGGALSVWVDDALIYRYDETGPRGYWVAATFCPQNADTRDCLDYAPAPAQRANDTVNLRWRTSPSLRLNWVWLFNYMSSGSGHLQLDDVVVATERVGCRR